MSTTTIAGDVLAAPEKDTQARLEAVTGRPAEKRGRLLDAVVLGVIVAFQAAWLGAIGYVAWLLFV